jgi:MFS family permease
VFQLAGGVLADRMDRLRLLLVTQLFTALTLAATFGLALAGDLRVAALLGLAALSNSFRAFDEPSRLALVPELIDRERLPNAIALSSIPWQAGRMIGPSVTGILIAAFGGTVGLALATLASFAALGLYSRLRLEAHPPVQDRGHALGQFIQGLAFIKDNFVFAALISLALFNAVFGLSYVTLLPVYADVYFGTGSTGFGLLNAAHGTGALTGTLTIATLGHLIRRPGVIVLMTAVGMGLSLVAFALSPRMGPAIAMLLALGFANTFYLTQVSTFIQSNVPDQLRGRVLAVYSLCWNLLPLGGLIAGGLAAAFDARVALVIGGALVAANALLLLSSRRLRAIR